MQKALLNTFNFQPTRSLLCSGTSVCLDSNQNMVDCGDSDCTYGPCGTVTTSGSQSGATACLDANENPCACADPTCTYGDCQQSAASHVGLSGIAQENGGLTLTSPSHGGATGGLSTQILSPLASLANTISTAMTGPPKTTLSLGASGLTIGSAGSIFSNPLMLVLLAVITVLLFGLFRKRG